MPEKTRLKVFGWLAAKYDSSLSSFKLFFHRKFLNVVLSLTKLSLKEEEQLLRIGKCVLMSTALCYNMLLNFRCL